MLSMVQAMCKFDISVLSFHAALLVLVGGSSNISTNRYTCSKSCVRNNTHTTPVMYKASSGIKCAAECSKQSWCSRYMFLKASNSSGLQLVSTPCQLFMDDGSKCLQGTTPALDDPVCYKITNQSVTIAQACVLTSERVLEVINSKPNIPNGQAYLKNLLTIHQNLKIQFAIGVSSYSANANYFTMGTTTSVLMCASVLDTMTGPLNLTINRSFCSDGSQTLAPPTMDVPDQFSWDIQVSQGSSLVNKETIFTTGADPASLMTAVNNALDINLLFIDSGKICHGDVISLNKNTNEIAIQTRLYENEQLKILSHLADGSTEVVIWTPSTSTSTGPFSETSQTKWFSSSCWKAVPSSSSTGSTQAVSDLRNSIESGRRIRVKIVISDLVVVAAPDYLEIDSISGTVTGFLLRVLLQKSFLGGLLDLLTGSLSLILGGGNSSTQWTHYMITSNRTDMAFTCNVGSSKCTMSPISASVQWFEEVQNWTLVHVSYPVNRTVPILLAAKVLKGHEVRIKVETGDNQSWFSCHMVQVIDNGQEVKCQVRGQVSINMTDSSTKSGTLSNILPSQTKTANACIRSDCFVISASVTSTDVFNSCLWPSAECSDNSARPDRVEWFVTN